MSTRLYPLYQRGNPQLRIFLPNFWMKIVRPKEPIPPNKVLFQTSVEMTHHDVKNYLEKIYNIPVVDVRIEIKMGETRKAPGKYYIIKDDDYKEALVTLPSDQTFEFPDLFPQKRTEDIEEMKETVKDYAKKKRKFIHRSDVPAWFQ